MGGGLRLVFIFFFMVGMLVCVLVVFPSGGDCKTCRPSQLSRVNFCGALRVVGWWGILSRRFMISGA